MNHEIDKTGDGVFCDTAGAALTKWNLIAGAVVLIAGAVVLIATSSPRSWGCFCP